MSTEQKSAPCSLLRALCCLFSQPSHHRKQQCQNLVRQAVNPFRAGFGQIFHLRRGPDQRFRFSC